MTCRKGPQVGFDILTPFSRKNTDNTDIVTNMCDGSVLKCLSESWVNQHEVAGNEAA